MTKKAKFAFAPSRSELKGEEVKKYAEMLGHISASHGVGEDQLENMIQTSHKSLRQHADVIRKGFHEDYESKYGHLRGEYGED